MYIHIVQGFVLAAVYIPFVRSISLHPNALAVLTTAPKLLGSRRLSQITVKGNASRGSYFSVSGILKIPGKIEFV